MKFKKGDQVITRHWSPKQKGAVVRVNHGTIFVVLKSLENSTLAFWHTELRLIK